MFTVHNTYYSSQINQSGYMNEPTKDQRQKTHIIQDDLILLSRRQPYWLNKTRATVSKRLHPESMASRSSAG
jgi:hypothetical protein